VKLDKNASYSKLTIIIKTTNNKILTIK